MQEPQAPELPEVPHTRGGLPVLLTVPEVAAALRVDASTVYRAVTAGRLEAVRLGGRGSTVRIRAEVLEELLERRRAPRRRAGANPQPQEAT